jgi:hypothetical protein
MRARVVPELLDHRMPVERLLDQPALNPTTPAVNQPDLPETRRVRGMKILLDDVYDVRRRKRVEIQRVFDRQFVHCQGS